MSELAGGNLVVTGAARAIGAALKRCNDYRRELT